MCVRAYVRACVRVCVCACVHARVFMYPVFSISQPHGAGASGRFAQAHLRWKMAHWCLPKCSVSLDIFHVYGPKSSHAQCCRAALVINYNSWFTLSIPLPSTRSSAPPPLLGSRALRLCVCLSPFLIVLNVQTLAGGPAEKGCERRAHGDDFRSTFSQH